MVRRASGDSRTSASLADLSQEMLLQQCPLDRGEPLDASQQFAFAGCPTAPLPAHSSRHQDTLPARDGQGFGRSEHSGGRLFRRVLKPIEQKGETPGGFHPEVGRQDELGQPSHRGPFKQLPHRQPVWDQLLQPHAEFRGHQRIAAEVKEALVQTHRFQAEHVGPNRGDLLLKQGPRRNRIGRGVLGPSVRPFTPSGQFVELPAGEHLTAGPAAGLAAGGLGQGSPGDQHHCVGRYQVFFRQLAADATQDLIQVDPSRGSCFLHHHQSLPAVDVARERHAAVGLQGGMAAGNRLLDIVRVVVAPVENNQLFQSPGDKKLAVVEKPQISGSQECVVGLTGQAGEEDPLGLLRPVPVSLCDGGPPNPDFSHLAGLQFLPGPGIDDGDLVSGPRSAAADQPATIGICRVGRLRTVLLQPPLRERPHQGGLAPVCVGYGQDGFGQPVGGQERLRAKAVGCELLRESIERVGPHRLSGHRGNRPATQIEVPAVFGADFPGAKLVSEIRCAGCSATVMGDGPQPAHGALDKGHRGHQNRPPAAVNGQQHSADEPEVVIRRQPHHAHGPFDILPVHSRQVVHQVAVAQGHPPRRTGRPRSVLEYCKPSIVVWRGFPVEAAAVQ